MKRAGSILILIVFIIESILIIPLLWTIPGFILYNKINKDIATEGQQIAFAILGIIFGNILGLIGGILILVDISDNKKSENNNKEHVIDLDNNNDNQVN